MLHRSGLRFRIHVAKLCGKPDIVFGPAKVAVFIDGDFWHGWQFPRWQHKLTPYWRKKIYGNRERDKRNFRRLRRNGWRVIRIWEHEIDNCPDGAVARITEAVRERVIS